MFIDNDPLIIHNADFDVGFINNELSLLGRSRSFQIQLLIQFL